MPINKFMVFTSLVTILFVVAGCEKLVPIPSGQDDHPPVLNVSDLIPNGTGTLDVTDHGITGQALTAAGTEIIIISTATNPGGVQSLDLTVTRSGNTLYHVQKVKMPSGMPPSGPDRLFILDVDGSGNLNSRIKFTMNSEPVYVTTTSSNFNGSASTITVTYTTTCEICPPNEVADENCICGCPFHVGSDADPTGRCNGWCCGNNEYCCNGQCIPFYRDCCPGTACFFGYHCNSQHPEYPCCPEGFTWNPGLGSCIWDPISPGF